MKMKAKVNAIKVLPEGTILVTLAVGIRGATAFAKAYGKRVEVRFKP